MFQNLHATNNSTSTIQTQKICYSLTLNSGTPGVRFSDISVALICVPASMLATIGNMMALYAFIKYARLQTASHTLLGFLSLTDLPVGIIVQPIYAAMCMKHTLGLGADFCSLQMFHGCISYVVCGCSILTLGLVSMDRCLAISFPYRYRVWYLKTTYAITVSITWSIAIAIVALNFTGKISFTTLNLITFGLICVLFGIILVCYSIIFCRIRNSRRSVVDRNAQRSVETMQRRERRSAKTIGIIVLAFAICYGPRIIFAGIAQMLNWGPVTRFHLSRWSALLVFINSSLNPVIYWMRMEDVRGGMQEIIVGLREKVSCRKAEPMA